MSRFHAHLAAVTLGLLLPSASARIAAADAASEKAAQAAFDAGMKLMKQRKLAEACPKLEESQRLDPGMATAFRLAECYEGIGKLAKAWELFAAVAAEAKSKGNAQREHFARKRADAIEPKLARVAVVVAAGLADTPGLTITRDGEEVPRSRWGAALPVDPGEHTIRATAPGKKAWESRTAPLQGGTRVEIAVPLLDDERAAAPRNEPAPAAPAPAKRSVVPAIVLGSAAAVGAGLGIAGLVVGAGKRGTAADLKTSLGNGSSACAGASPPAACAQLKSAYGSAATFENLALWSFVGAGVALAGTLTYVLWPAPKAPATSLQLTPVVGAGLAGAVAAGSF